MSIKIYNSSDRLVWEGDYNGLLKLRREHMINDSDRIVFEEENTWLEQAYQQVKDYLAEHPEQEQDLIEALKFNVKGLTAEANNEDFDWLAKPLNKDIVNEVLGGILMDYTIKASYEDIIELDNYLIGRLEKGEQ